MVHKHVEIVACAHNDKGQPSLSHSIRMHGVPSPLSRIPTVEARVTLISMDTADQSNCTVFTLDLREVLVPWCNTRPEYEMLSVSDAGTNL